MKLEIFLRVAEGLLAIERGTLAPSGGAWSGVGSVLEPELGAVEPFW